LTSHAAYATSRINSNLKGSTKQFGWLQPPQSIVLSFEEIHGILQPSEFIGDFFQADGWGGACLVSTRSTCFQASLVQISLGQRNSIASRTDVLGRVDFSCIPPLGRGKLPPELCIARGPKPIQSDMQTGEYS
jgi:hypothetical protein